MFYFLQTYNPYIPWDTAVVEEAIALLRANIGAAITVGLWIFFGLSGIYLVATIISYLGK